MVVPLLSTTEFIMTKVQALIPSSNLPQGSPHFSIRPLRCQQEFPITSRYKQEMDSVTALTLLK
jgi:hypothetical protein